MSGFKLSDAKVNDAKELVSVDINTIDESDNYYLTSCSNTPNGHDGHLNVFSRDVNNKVFYFTSDTNFRTYKKVWKGGVVVHDWSENYNTSNINSIQSEVNILTPTSKIAHQFGNSDSGSSYTFHTPNLAIKSSNFGNGILVSNAVDNSKVHLYYNGVEKATTENDGVKVQGRLNVKTNAGQWAYITDSNNSNYSGIWLDSSHNTNFLGRDASGNLYVSLSSSVKSLLQHGLYTYNDIELNGLHSKLRLGNNTSGITTYVGTTRYSANGTSATNRYESYFAYDMYYDYTNDVWKANRTNLGRKYMMIMGYHSNEVAFFTKQTAATSWNTSDMTKLFYINSVGNTYAAGAVHDTGQRVYSANNKPSLSDIGYASSNNTWTGTNTFNARVNINTDEMVQTGNAPRHILQETGVSNTPDWWMIADGGNFSLRLNNTGNYPLHIMTNSSNDTIEKVVFGYESYVNSNRMFHDGYHPNADRWTTSRSISLAGDASGSVSFNGSANATLTATVNNAAKALKWSSSRTLSLSGDASGSVSFDGSANVTMDVSVGNDSHTHDGRYFTESESDARFVKQNTTRCAAQTDAAYGTTSSSSTGTKIRLPYSTSSSKMISFTVRAYQGYKPYTINFSGYLYPTSDNWYSPKVIMESGHQAIAVKMGKDNDGRAYVWLEGDNYRGVSVFNVAAGYNAGNFNTGWEIQISDDHPNEALSSTVYPPYSPHNKPSASDLGVMGLDLDGNTSYQRMVTTNGSGWVRANSTGTGLLPYSNGNSYIGTSSWKFKEMHSVNFYENGTLLSSKYAAKSHGHTIYSISDDPVVDYGANKLQFCDLSGADHGTGLDGAKFSRPTNDWYYHLIMNHANSSGYYVDLAACFHHDGLYMRRLENGTLGNWNRFYNDSYHPEADYSTTSGWADQVDVNASDANASYGLVWHSGDTLYGSASELYINPRYGMIIAGNTSRRRAGMYGTYDSNKVGHIWSMGTAYTIHESGTDFGSLYGFAYKHTNNSTGGTMGGGHMAVWCQNGTPYVSLGTNIWAKYDITAYSDARVKTDVKIIENALEKIHKVKGVTYLRTDVVGEDANKRHAGFIAQDWIGVLDEVVMGGATEQDPDAHYSLAYGNITSILVEGIKEVDNKLEENNKKLEEENQLLKDRLTNLEKLVEQLLKDKG